MKIKNIENSMKIENYKLKIALALIIFLFFGLNSAKAGGRNAGYWSFDGKDMA